MQSTRELTRDDMTWRVREADTSDCPGARAAKCLIFDGDGIVRRAWSYPENWAELDDETLWSLLETPRPKPLDPSPAARQESAAEGTHPAVAEATANCARSRSLLVELSMFRAANRAASPEPRSLIGDCWRVRRAMRDAIEAYARSLRSSGVAPEHALVRIKAALKDGIGAAEACEEPAAEELVGDGVAWGIAAYYAA